MFNIKIHFDSIKWLFYDILFFMYFNTFTVLVLSIVTLPKNAISSNIFSEEL
jgi:hypothetical protein